MCVNKFLSLVALLALNANGAGKYYLLQQEKVISGTFKNKFLSNKTVTIGKNSCLILQNISRGVKLGEKLN